MYYAFYTRSTAEPWKGVIELRGLGRGKFRVTDYTNGRDFGTVEGPTGRIAVEFEHYLLLEVVKV